MRSAVKRGGRQGAIISILPIALLIVLLIIGREPLITDTSLQVMLVAVLGSTLLFESVFFVLIIAQGGRILNLDEPDGVLRIIALLLVAEPALLGLALAFSVNTLIGGLLTVFTPIFWMITNTLARQLPDDAV